MSATPDTTVLVVDDVDANRYAMGAVLRRAGHLVVPSACAGDALAELDLRLRAGTLPDAALVDVGLPDMSGYELCRRMKQQPGIAAMPVVHFSAAAITPHDRSRGLDAGAEAYLTVPVEPEEMQAVVRAALRGARTRHDAEEQAGRLALLASLTMEVHSAHSLQELAEAAAAGASGLTGGPAAAFVFGVGGRLHMARERQRGGPRPDAQARAAVTTLLQRAGIARTGAWTLVAPAPLWPAGLFGRSGSGRPQDVRLLLARGRLDDPPVCLATPLRETHDAETAMLLTELAHATSVAAESLRAHAEERNIALTLQHSFMPQKAPALPGAELALRYVPASRHAEIGGDFYVALSTPTGLLVGVGDVVGHSLDAATVMVELRHALRAYAADEQDPAILVRRLDRMLQLYHPEATATVCLALIEPRTGRIRVANAGHIQPLVIPDRGEARYVQASGPLLGLGLDHPPADEDVLTGADRLLMLTDGLIESRGTDLAVSLEHLRTASTDTPPGVSELCDTLLGNFGNREDDIALLALRLTNLCA
ncbi:MAG TPA: fused response regulator/phosphatase [Streptomyces sp.]|nr:fused response regulator/phosphatase [Streptomyces sp.]